MRTAEPRVIDLGVVPEARGFWERYRGLRGAGDRRVSAGLFLPDCQAVHTFGMRVSPDLVFMDGEGRVGRVRHATPPRRVVWGGKEASAVLELAAGRARRLGLEPGCVVRWQGY